MLHLKFLPLQKFGLVYFSPRTDNQKGGVAVCVHRSIKQYTERLVSHAEDSVYLRVGKETLNSAFDFLAAFVYVAPERSVVYDDDTNGIDVVNGHMTEVTRQYPYLPWFICGV